jgi:hypothetical protein
MKSKPIIVAISAIMAVVLLTGACSAGFVAGTHGQPALAGCESLQLAAAPRSAGSGQHA